MRLKTSNFLEGYGLRKLLAMETQKHIGVRKKMLNYIFFAFTRFRSVGRAINLPPSNKLQNYLNLLKVLHRITSVEVAVDSATGVIVLIGTIISETAVTTSETGITVSIIIIIVLTATEVFRGLVQIIENGHIIATIMILRKDKGIFNA